MKKTIIIIASLLLTSCNTTSEYVPGGKYDTAARYDRDFVHDRAVGLDVYCGRC